MTQIGSRVRTASSSLVLSSLADPGPPRSTAWPNGIKPVALPMDGDGLTVDGMDHVLANWNPQEHDGMQRCVAPICVA